MAAETRLGPYRILRLINRGGQGTVFLAYDSRLQRKVAIKIYRLPRRGASRRRFLREAQLVAAMDSPKVVKLHDIIDSPESLALVMEYIPGCDLEEFLSSTRPSLASVLTICSDVAGALAALRQQRIVHGDIKASNILITESGRVKLSDFGIARAVGSVGAGPGSLTAVSPEQYLGQSMDGRSDLFVLGCLMYRLLAGREAFCRDGKIDESLLLEQGAEPLQDVMPSESMPPQELLALLDSLLQIDPAQRPGSTHEVRRVLRELARTIPQGTNNSLLEEARPFFRRESEEDMPPSIPQELIKLGRSRFDTKVGSGLLYWLRQPRHAALVASGLLFIAGISLVLHDRTMRVHVEHPAMQLEMGMVLPDGVSRDWLMTESLEAVRERVGPIEPVGPGAGKKESTFYSPSAEGARPPPEKERLEIGLRCQDSICVYDATRVCGDERSHGQAVLFPDLSQAQWRGLIHSAVATLYP